MFRSRNCLYPPPLPPSPLSFSALSVNGACRDPVGVLRKTRSLTQTDPPAPFVPPRHPSLAAIPFRITFFAHPHRLTPIESYSCKKQGRGWGAQPFHSTQPLPLFSTASKHPTHSNARNSHLFIRLLHVSLDTRGWGWATILGCRHPGFSIFASQVTGQGTPVTSSPRGSANGACPDPVGASPRYPFPFRLSTVDCQPLSFPRTSTLPPPIYGIIPPHRGTPASRLAGGRISFRA
jgi:hypothetical protein